MRYKQWAGAAAMVTWGVAATAQDEVAGREQASTQRLAPLTVTATRTAADPDEVSRSVSIVPQYRIETRQSPDVLPLLRELPGVSSASNGGLAGQLVIRGFSTQGFRAPLFVDGDRFRGRNTIEYTFFNPDQIERIEVVRGPASSLYGTDSFGGVVNIITKRATGDVSEAFRFNANQASIDYGTVNDRFGSHVQVGGVGDGFDFLLSGSFRDAGDYDSPLGEIPNSSFQSQNVRLRGGYTFAPGQRIGLTAAYAAIERERAGGQFAAPGALNGPGVPLREQDDRSNRQRYGRLFYEAESLFDGAVRDVEASLYRRDIDTHVNVVPDARNPETFVDVFVVGPTVTGGRVKGVSDLSRDLSLTYGSDWYFEDRGAGERSVSGGERMTRGPQSDQLSIGTYALAEWQATPALRLDASIRYDYVRTRLDTSFIDDPTTRMLFEDAGDTENNPVTGGIGALWDVTDVVSVFGNVTSAFRAPSVTEISAVGSGVNAQFRVPNPDIEPERAVNYEAGLRLRWPTAEANITGFVNNLDDLIDRNVPVTFQGMDALQIQNIGEARITGVEAEAVWLPTDNWLFRANATYTRGEDTENDRPLPQIPPVSGLLGARWEPSSGRYYIEGTLEWALEQDRVDATQERATDGYAVASLYAGYDLSRHWSGVSDATLRLSIENLFDTTYRLHGTPEDIRFPQSPTNPLVEPGRSFVVSIDARF